MNWESLSLQATAKRRVLLVGINYAPEQTGIAPYTTGMADHLGAKGFQVTVITGMPHYPQWKINPEYRGRLRMCTQSRDVDVLRVRQYTPSQQSAIRRALYELTFFAQAIGVPRLRKPDCVIGVVPSLSGGAAAALLARRFRVPLGLVFQDLVGQAAAQSGMPGGGIAAHPARFIEAYTARKADNVAVVAEAFESYLTALGVAPRSIMHLPNWSHVNSPTLSAEEVRSSLGWDPEARIVLHAGNIGYKQDLDNVVRAARLATENGTNINFVLMGDGTDRHRLELAASGLPNLSFLDPQPDGLFMEILGAADVLLLNERSTVLGMSLPSKITSYFCAGRPVVAAVPTSGATSDELMKSRGALVVNSNDPGALLSAVHLVLSDHGLSSELVAQARLYADRNLDSTALLQRVTEFVEATLAGAAETR